MGAGTPRRLIEIGMDEECTSPRHFRTGIRGSDRRDANRVALSDAGATRNVVVREITAHDRDANEVRNDHRRARIRRRNRVARWFALC